MPDRGMIGRIIDHYRIELMLGQGGMAAVYKATDLQLERDVAIKVMHPHLASQASFQQRFLQEARAAARLDHPNIVRVFSFDSTGDDLFIVMEMALGGNLRQYIRRLHDESREFDYQEAIELMRQLSEALDYAHQQGMIHRDIKPDNVLLKPDTGELRLNYRPILTDFGLARLTTGGENAVTDQQPIGTYPYMSPEQSMADELDARSDIYSLGIMLYEISAGKLPFNPKTIFEAAKMHRHDALTLPSAVRPDFPPELEQIVVRALSKNRDDRYASAGEMARALQALLKPVQVPVRTPTPVIAAAPPPRRPPPPPSADAGISTDLTTATMTEALPEEMPPITEPPWDAEPKFDRLVFYNPLYPPLLFNLEKHIVVAGRDAERDIVLAGDGVSRRHVEIERKPNGKYTITDLGATNGVWLADRRLVAGTPVILNPGVTVRVGDYWMVLQSKSDAPKALEPEATLMPPAPVDVQPVDQNGASPVLDVTMPTPPPVVAMPQTPPPQTPPAMPAMPKPSAPKAEAPDPLDVLLSPASPSAPAAAKMDAKMDERLGRLEDVMGDLVGDDSAEGIQTQPLSEAALQREMPRHTPPHITADQVGFDRLVFYSENSPTVTARLDKERMTIGRAKRQDIVLPGRAVSRHHAHVDLAADGKHYIVDVGSTSGTWLDGQRLEVNTSVRLEPGKVMRIGDYWMQYELKRALPLPMAPMESDIEIEADANQTAVMVKPLAEDLPQYSPPPLTVEMRTNDRLIFFSEDHPMKIIKLDKEVLRVGRGEGQDVPLEGKRVSRQHALIEIKSDGNIYVTDQNSANGIWMGDTLLVANTPVQWDTKEIIRLGNYWVKFEQGSRDFDPFSAGGQQEKWGRIGKTIKNYRIDRFVGQSDVAAVYKATQFPLNRPVALKILHPNLAAEEMLKQRFLREARMLSRLDHPNIVKVNTADNADNELFMVMEFISPFSLRSYLKKFKDQDRHMDYGEAIGLVIQIAGGLHYAHQQGMIHRDMTPESIVLREIARIGPVVKYQPVLTDFTVAYASDSGEIYATDKPQVNYPYMSPEQCLGERVDLRSDIYELGVVLFEMLVGRPPYQPRSIAEAIRMHAREPLPRFRDIDLQSNIPDDVEKIVRKALEKNPNNRWQDAAAFALALRRTNLVASDEESASAGASGLVSVDDQVTEVIFAQPKEMPLPTRGPALEESHEFPRLVIYSADEQTRVFDLKQDVMTIGRADDQDITLASKKVSRRHARLEKGIGGFFRLTDLSSRNGSWLGSYKLVANVSEIWEEGETARLGDSWLRIEPPYDADANISNDGDQRVEDVVEAPPRPQVVIITPDQEKIGVVVGNPMVRVAPGSSITLPVEVINRSEVVDHFRVEAIGLPGNWVTQPSEALYLLPHSRDTTSITFHPPLESNSAAGAHAYEIRVSAQAQNASSTASQGALTIEPFYGFTTDLQPERIRGNGRAELMITNTGNSHEAYSVVARDREQAVNFDLDGKQYVLSPGYTEYISIRVRPKRRPLIGMAHTFPFEIMVTPVPADKGVPPRSETGEVVAPARLRTWMIGGCLLLLLLIGIIAAVIILGVVNTNNQNATVTVVAMATSQSVNMTATAVADTDGDGLSNAKEAELQTDPNNPDTDGDGLTDREEVQVWQTNPLNRDTDGDTLSDGDEVKMGLNPSNRDTDGDGLPDNVDSNPGALPTPTITPFPTITGSNGDICPGSPSPSAMAVGIQGVVTEGGVANRLRDKPGKKDSKILGYLPPGTSFIVVDGPVCDPDDQIRWWQVNFNGLIGWTAEGEKKEFYLAPAGEATPQVSASESTDGSIANPPKVVAKLDAARMGVQVDWNVQDASWNQLLDMTKPMQIDWIKVQASWRGLEPENGTLGADASKLQAYLKMAHDQGFKVMISLDKAPDWARPNNKTGDGPPDDPEEIGHFLKLLLDQMGGDIDAIEVWNEPNLVDEWAGTLPFNGAGYMSLFQPAYNAIRAYSKTITIITAGLAPTSTTDGSINDRLFLRQMYQSGLGGFKDIAIGIHPYSWGNPPDERCCNIVDGRSWDDKPQLFFLNTLDTYRGIMAENGQTSAPLWVTEFGWASWDGFSSSEPDAWMTYNTPDDQAAYALKAFGIGQALNYVGTMFLWNLNFANPTTIASQNQVAGYSLLVMDNSIHPRPMYDSFIHLRQS